MRVSSRYSKHIFDIFTQFVHIDFLLEFDIRVRSQALDNSFFLFWIWGYNLKYHQPKGASDRISLPIFISVAQLQTRKRKCLC